MQNHKQAGSSSGGKKNKQQQQKGFHQISYYSRHLLVFILVQLVWSRRTEVFPIKRTLFCKKKKNNKH